MKYCILRSSIKLRNAIRHRLKERGSSDNAMCVKLGIPRQNFHNFMKGDYTTLSQTTVLKICKELGIVVDLQVTLI